MQQKQTIVAPVSYLRSMRHVGIVAYIQRAKEMDSKFPQQSQGVHNMMADTQKNKQNPGDASQQYSKKKKSTPCSIPQPIEIPGLGTVFEGIKTNVSSEDDNVIEGFDTVVVNMTKANDSDQMVALEKKLKGLQTALNTMIALL